MPLPLSGIKVVEMAQVLAGPFVAMMFADQGADVIKVEPPDGDSARRTPPTYGTDDLSQSYLSFGRNKRSIVLDVGKPESDEVIRKLVEWADVLIIATRVSARTRRGLTYEALSAINPRLIYASITGFGEQGPEADLPGVDILVQARVGDLDARRQPDAPPPPHSSLVHFDMGTAMLTGFGIALALRERDQTGRGQKVEANILQSALVSQSRSMTSVEGFERTPVGPPTGLPANYLCADGRYLFVSAGGARWDAFCKTLGLDDLLADERFNTAPKRAQNAPVLFGLLSQQFATKPAAEWEATLKAGGHMANVIRTIAEVHDDPQVVANEMLTRYEQPGLGTVTAINFPVKLSGTGDTTPPPRRPAPRLGANTDDVLRDLGYDAARIEGLRSTGVVA